MTKNPLVTCILVTYNQSRYIELAIDGLLRQDYRDIEIIISDDASTDNTQARITAHLENYDGPHNVILNFNKSNMGISRHIRYLHKMSKGDIIVHAAGDDISESSRVSKIVSAFMSQSHPSMVISNATKIDAAGTIIGRLAENAIEPTFEKAKNILFPASPFNGCTVAITKELIDAFEDPIDGLLAEDVVLSRRAHLLNGVYYLPECLVKYRVHSMSISNFNKQSWLEKINYNRKVAKEILKTSEQFKLDAQAANRLITKDEDIALQKQQRLNKLLLDVIDAPLFYSALQLTNGLLTSTGNILYKKRILSLCFARMMLFVKSVSGDR